MKARFVGGLLISAGAGLLFASTMLAAGKPGSSDVPLEVSIANSNGYGVYNDGGGWYISGSQNVRAVLVNNTNGNFVFDTNDNSSIDGARRLHLVFPTQVPTGSPFAPNSELDIDAYFGTLGLTGTSADGNLRTMAAGQTLLRKGPISWVQGSLQYALRFDGGRVGTQQVGLLSFTCNSSDALGCSNWTLVPTGVAQLDSTPTKGASTRTVYGVINMPFLMTLTRQ